MSTCSAAAGTLQNLSREAASRQLIRQQGAVPLLAALLSASDLQVTCHLLLDMCVLCLMFLLCLLAQHLNFPSCRKLTPFMSVHCKLRPCVCSVLIAMQCIFRRIVSNGAPNVLAGSAVRYWGIAEHPWACAGPHTQGSRSEESTGNATVLRFDLVYGSSVCISTNTCLCSVKHFLIVQIDVLACKHFFDNRKTSSIILESHICQCPIQPLKLASYTFASMIEEGDSRLQNSSCTGYTGKFSEENDAGWHNNRYSYLFSCKSPVDSPLIFPSFLNH
jgi:hypothetical protein